MTGPTVRAFVIGPRSQVFRCQPWDALWRRTIGGHVYEFAISHGPDVCEVRVVRWEYGRWHRRQVAHHWRQPARADALL